VGSVVTSPLALFLPGQNAFSEHEGFGGQG
jgi:hypothetical protein